MVNSTRDFYKTLIVSTKYTTWINNNINHLELFDGEDFIKTTINSTPGSPPIVDYLFSDLAYKQLLDKYSSRVKK